MGKRFIFGILRAAISAGLILFLVWLMRHSLGDVALAIKKINKPLLFFSLLLSILGFMLLAVRLKVIMAAQRINVTLKDTASLTFIGQFFSNFLPTSIGGDVVKAYYTSRRTGERLPSIACILFDRMLGTFTLFLMALVSYAFAREVFYNKKVIIFIIIALVALVASCLILFSKRVAKRIPLLKPLFKAFSLQERMKGLYNIIYNYKNHPAFILNAVLLSFSLQVITFYAVYLIIRGLGFSVPIKMVLLLMPIISTVSMAPSINGLGVRESAFVMFFGPLMTKEAAFALSILWLGFTFLLSLIGGLLYLFDKRYSVHRKRGC